MTAIVAIIMGVSGSGKSTIGRGVSLRLGWRFQEGDDLHSPDNIRKLHAGQPLNDADREPWLDAIIRIVDGWRAAATSGIVACSALKRRYRDRLIGGRAEVRLVFLTAEASVLRDRLARRAGHFMPAAQLDSQLAQLEAPAGDERPLTVDVARPLAETEDQVAAFLIAAAAARPRPAR